MNDKILEDFEVHIKPLLNKLDDVRLTLVKRINYLYLWMAVSCVFVLFSFWYLVHSTVLVGDDYVYVIILLALIVNGWLWIIDRIKKRFRLRFKNAVILKLVETVNPNFSYEPKKYITKKQFLRSNLFFATIDRYKGEDYISGNVDGVQIEFSELEVEDYQHEFASEYRLGNFFEVFYGQFMIAKFDHAFEGSTYILPKKAEPTFWKLGSAIHELKESTTVCLQDDSLDDKYLILGTDHDQAVKIVESDVAKFVLDLDKKMKADIYLSFIGSKAYLGVASPYNFFEANLKKPLNNGEAIQRFYNELMLCLNLVEDLNLNTRIWGKE